jgi:putative PIN family toxin of toxin-antitoxin system
LLTGESLTAYVTSEILTEYQETVDELKARYPQNPLHISLNKIAEVSRLVIPSRKFELCRDPDDNKFIDCAYAGKCIYIVSGDKDLLVIGAVEDIEIVTPEQFCEKYLRNDQ